VIGLALVAAALGCAKRPPTHYYVLQAVHEETATSAVVPGGDRLRVGVATFQIDPPYDQDRIVYRVGLDSPEIGYYAYHRWAMPLSRMLPMLVAESFGGIDRLQSIEPEAPGTTYDAYLGGRCVALEEVDVTDGPRVHARIRLELRLADGSVVWTRNITVDDDASDDDVLGIVERMRAALRQALADAAADLGRALGS
jgi:ABC-type uncharacterized transport system auxiliary subunit